MIVGIGDSNLEFGGHGWRHGFSRLTEWQSLLYYPGGSSREVVQRLKNMNLTETDVPDGARVLVTLGINDALEGVMWNEFCRNHMKIKRTVEGMVGPREWIWMPGHWQYPGSPICHQMEDPFFWPFFFGLRAALKRKARKKNIEFWDLRNHWSATYYRAHNDPYHLKEKGYEVLAKRVFRAAMQSEA